LHEAARIFLIFQSFDKNTLSQCNQDSKKAPTRELNTEANNTFLARESLEDTKIEVVFCWKTFCSVSLSSQKRRK
jgi:hypothetical protein